MTTLAPARALRILHLEDSLQDAGMIRNRLEVAGLRCAICLTQSQKDFEAALRRESFDLIITDYSLPGYDGTVALKEAQAAQPDVPVILISGKIGEEDAVRCLHVGATDYVLKHRLERLVPAVERALQEAETRRTHRRAEAAVVDSEARKAAILDSVLDSIITTDASGTVIEFNAAASRTFGYRKAEAIGRAFADLIIPVRFREKRRADMARYVATGEGPFVGALMEITAVRSDGTELPVEQAITVVGTGSAAVFTNVIRDITARQEADANRTNLAAIVDSSDDSIFSMAMDGTILSWNAGAERLYGYVASEMIGQSRAVLVPAGRDGELVSIMAGAARGEVGRPLDTQGLRKDGSVVDISVVISPMKDPTGRVTSVSTIARDTTSQGKAVRALRASEVRYRRLFEAARDGILILDAISGEIIAVNPFLADLLGYSQRDLFGKKLWEIGPFEDVKASKIAFKELQREECIRYDDLPLETRDGRAIAVEFVSNVYMAGPDKVIQCNIRDITERKRTQAAAQEAERRYRSLFASMLDGFAECQMLFEGDRPQDFVYLAVNAAFERLTGLHNVVGRRVTEVIPGIKEAGGGLLETYGRVVRTGQSERFEQWLEPLDMWLDISVYRTEGERFVAIFDNITDRKRMERALQAGLDEFRSLAEAMPQIVWITRPDGGNIYFNEQWMAYTGLTIAESLGHGWTTPFHPDDRLRAEEAWQNATATGGTYAVESRLRRVDGVYRWWLVRGVPVRDATGQIIKWFGTCTDIHELKEAAETLRATEDRVQFALASADVGIWDIDYTTGVLEWSDTMAAQYGLKPGTFAGTFEAFVELVHPADRASLLEVLGRALKTGTDFSMLNRSIWPDKTVHWLSGVGHVVLDQGGEPVRALGISQDITERRTLEAQFQQAQKMEAIGQLAGGVAHDFNNLLTVILGFCELLLVDFDPDDPRQADIAEVQRAGLRAAGLTRQLLAFSRKEIIEPTLLDLNAILTEMRPMLGRLLREDVKLLLGLGQNLRGVIADRGQMEQVVLNFAVNAQDAMPKGGTLTMETANIDLDEDYAATHFGVKPGQYVVLTVTDTGTGMTPEVQARLFEPFFTTKEVGKGTGLGLATIHGIATRSGGSVKAYSEVGRGTAFKLYLPQTDGSQRVVDVPTSAVPARTGTETVLVVEDADGLRELASRLLKRLGYTVLVAANADEAFELFAQHPSIDVLLTDVVMPGASGSDLAHALVTRRPTLKVVYMSGYTEEAIVHHGVLKPGIAFLHKPFTSGALAGKLREVLDRHVGAVNDPA